MADIIPARPRSQPPRRNVAVVASQYHPQYMEGLVGHFKEELAQIAPGTTVRMYYVPGCFEIPIMVREVADKEGIDAIVAFGVLMEGETLHAKLISTAVTNALMSCSVQQRIPVIHEVLVVNDAAQAEARCLQPEINRGIEAARAAVRIMDALAEVRR